MNFILGQLNIGLMLGLTLGALLLLRPVLMRIFSPQQRVVIWLAGWGCGYLNLRKTSSLLPVTFQDLVTTRTGRFFDAAPAFLPSAYLGPGPYHLALPGGLLVRVELRDWLMWGLAAVWVAGMAVMLLLFVLRGGRLLKLARRGRVLTLDDPLLQEDSPLQEEKITWKDSVQVRIVPGLPASFVHYVLCALATGEPTHEVFLQEELSSRRLRLVMRHELEHVRLCHPWWKVLATFCLVEFWWNPLVWLGFRAFCRDLELACDAAVMKRLSPEDRREYARTLVELGAGRQLWESPLAFGECDAARRVKAAAGWRPRRWPRTLATWAAAAAVYLFFLGGSRVSYPSQDLMLAWEREGRSQTEFVQTLNQEMGEKLGLTPPGLPGLAPDLGIAEVWEAPNWEARERVPVAALWVRTRAGWYYVPYGWWGEEADTFGVLRAEEVPPPDLSGVVRLA